MAQGEDPSPKSCNQNNAASVRDCKHNHSKGSCSSKYPHKVRILILGFLQKTKQENKIMGVTHIALMVLIPFLDNLVSLFPLAPAD